MAEINMKKHTQFLIKDGWDVRKANSFQDFVHKKSKTIHGPRNLIEDKELAKLREEFLEEIGETDKEPENLVPKKISLGQTIFKHK